MPWAVKRRAITTQPVQLMTGIEDRQGALVLFDGVLVAVLIRLDMPDHGDLAGKWLLEAGFGVCSPPAPPFDSLGDAVAWAERQILR